MNNILQTGVPSSMLLPVLGGLLCAVFVSGFDLVAQNRQGDEVFPPSTEGIDKADEKRRKNSLLAHGTALEHFLAEGDRLWLDPRFADASLKLKVEISGVYGRDDLLIARFSNNEIKVIARSFNMVHFNEGRTPPAFRSETHDLSLFFLDAVPDSLSRLIDECSKLEKPGKNKEAYFLDSLGLLVRSKTKNGETSWAMQLAGMEKGSDVDRVALGIFRTIEELVKIDLWKKG